MVEEKYTNSKTHAKQKNICQLKTWQMFAKLIEPKSLAKTVEEQPKSNAIFYNLSRTGLFLSDGVQNKKVFFGGILEAIMRVHLNQKRILSCDRKNQKKKKLVEIIMRKIIQSKKLTYYN